MKADELALRRLAANCCVDCGAPLLEDEGGPKCGDCRCAAPTQAQGGGEEETRELALLRVLEDAVRAWEIAPGSLEADLLARLNALRAGKGNG